MNTAELSTPLITPTRPYPPEENPQLTKLSLTMYDEPYVPHVPVGLPHCCIVTQPRGNKREYTHTHTHTLQETHTTITERPPYTTPTSSHYHSEITHQTKPTR